MGYQLRKLSADDIFPMTNIVSKIGFKEFKNAFDPKLVAKLVKENKDKTGKKEELEAVIGVNVVFEVAAIIVENLNKCRTEIYAFLSSVSGLEEEKLKKELSPAELLQMVIDIIEKEEFKDFFKVVSKFIK